MAYSPNNPNGQTTMADSAPVVIASDQSNIGTKLNDSSGAAITVGQKPNSTSLPVVVSSDQISSVPVARNSSGVIVATAQPKIFRSTFANAVAAGADTAFFTTVVTGSGQTVSQSGGNLLLTTGTTSNSETILRSTTTFTGACLARIKTILSQRIVNQNFYVELVDVIGDGLTASASSATSLTVTIPSNPFTSANVGQFMYVGNLAGGLTGVPARYAIASVAGNNVTFTVAGFTVSSGTCSLFGWNYLQLVYNTATATNAFWDTQRRGYNSGFTTATINSTASPGHIAIMQHEDGNAYLLDQLVASTATFQSTVRASRVENLPEETTPLYLQIRLLNGSTAPASTTTWTIGLASVENYAVLPVSAYNVKSMGQGTQLPVTVTNTPAVSVSSGTITTVSTVTAVSAINSVATTNGLSIGTVVTSPTPSTNSIKATAGRLMFMYVSNPNAAAVYLKIFNVAAPTLGTTSANMNFMIPASSAIAIPINPIGLFFSTAIVTAVTGGIALADNTAITSGCALSYSWI